MENLCLGRGASRVRARANGEGLSLVPGTTGTTAPHVGSIPAWLQVKRARALAPVLGTSKGASWRRNPVDPKMGEQDMTSLAARRGPWPPASSHPPVNTLWYKTSLRGVSDASVWCLAPVAPWHHFRAQFLDGCRLLCRSP